MENRKTVRMHSWDRVVPAGRSSVALGGRREPGATGDGVGKEDLLQAPLRRPGGGSPRTHVAAGVMIAFEDLVVYFTWEEWQNMNKAQKILYRDVMLETYSSLFSLGYCRTKPDLIYKLEQGAEPWMIEECLSQSLPVAMKNDDIIRANQEIQEKKLNHNVVMNNKITPPKRLGLRKTFNLCSSRILKPIIKKENYSGMKPEEFNVCHNVYPPSGLDKLQAGGTFDVAKVPGNSLQCCQSLHQYHKMKTVAQSFEHSGKGKGFKKKKIFERVHMGETCWKETVGKKSQIEKSFHKNTNLNKHQQTNTGEKLYEDIWCMEPLTYKSGLTINQRAHIGKKPYACKPCGKSFNFKSCHAIHHSIQTQENPHVCSEYGEPTSQKADLIGHQKIHTKKQLHECNEHGKAIFQKSYLITHQRIHTGEKSHECNDGGKAILCKSDLRKHQRIQTEEKSFASVRALGVRALGAEKQEARNQAKNPPKRVTNRVMAERDFATPVTAPKLKPSPEPPTATPVAGMGPKSTTPLFAIELLESILLTRQLTWDDYWKLFQALLNMEEKLLQILFAEAQESVSGNNKKSRLDRDQCASCRKRGHWHKDCPDKNDSR
ncbi:zinc finger protein 717-like [Lepus europaeus]|uniref:zinc finger protein 717-like n=1 Tax=Lepus europaeus TaxID=9983 RepID=UPI002B45CB49|nr:zinc finger protein 717-like [Lepus europaeus]